MARAPARRASCPPPPLSPFVPVPPLHQNRCITDSHSLKSALVFSQPCEPADAPSCCGAAATRSASCSLSVLARSVHSSYIVLRLKSSVWDERPWETRDSRIWRPCILGDEKKDPKSAQVVGRGIFFGPRTLARKLVLGTRLHDAWELKIKKN